MARHHDNDDELIGLTSALRKLPASFRLAAYAELTRAFIEDGFAEFLGPEIIHFRGPDGGSPRQALLLIIECDNFIFDLFYVPNRRRVLVPVLGRAYFYPQDGYSFSTN